MQADCHGHNADVCVCVCCRTRLHDLHYNTLAVECGKICRLYYIYMCMYRADDSFAGGLEMMILLIVGAVWDFLFF